MRLPNFQYVEPGSTQEASAFLANHAEESKVIAGGTDLLPSMKQRVFRPEYVVNLSAIPNLDTIEFDEQSGLKIGALATLSVIEQEPVILEKYPAIAQAAHAVGAVQLKWMGTVGGNLCLDTRCYYYNQSDFWRRCRPTCIKMGGDTCNAVGGGKKCFAVFSGDLAPALIAMGANIRLLSAKGERTLPLNDLYSGDGADPVSIPPEEILTSVEIPAPAEGTFSTYLKYRIRQAIDFPLAGVAVKLVMNENDKACQDVKVVIGAVGPRPMEVEGIKELLAGKKLESPAIEQAALLAQKAAKPVDNAAGSPSYRKLMIKIFVEKALGQAMASV
jgi:4-hydroxybenzoyl-CoA reductase subunit beta